MADITVQISGLSFKTPVMTAAGPMARDGATLLEAAKGGAGGLVAKTVSVKPAEVPKPNIAAVESGRVGSRRGLLNAELWSELPLERWLKHEYPLALKAGLPLIASIGYTPEDVAKIGPLVESAGVSAIEFSTHYVGGHVEIAKALKQCVSIPVFAKLSPQVDVAKVAKTLEPYVDGIVAINTLGPCLRIDVETCRPVLGSDKGYGWMSGAALRPIAMRCVADIAQAVNTPIIASGGVMNGQDAIEFFMAGASAVQVCTAAILEGPAVYGRIATEIDKWLDSHDHSSVESVRGVALPYLKKKRLLKPPVRVDTDGCTLCGLCAKSCAYSALNVDSQAKTLHIDSAACVGCGLCISLCPEHALSGE